jgi:hypothetical protein
LFSGTRVAPSSAGAFFFRLCALCKTSNDRFSPAWVPERKRWQGGDAGTLSDAFDWNSDPTEYEHNKRKEIDMTKKLLVLLAVLTLVVLGACKKDETTTTDTSATTDTSMTTSTDYGTTDTAMSTDTMSTDTTGTGMMSTDTSGTGMTSTDTMGTTGTSTTSTTSGTAATTTT